MYGSSADTQSTGTMTPTVRSHAPRANVYNPPMYRNLCDHVSVGAAAAASYLIVAGTIGLAWPVIGTVPLHAELEAQSGAYLTAVYFAGIPVWLAFFVSGCALFLGKPWARKAAAATLLVGTVYGGHLLAWSYTGGAPSAAVLLGSYAATAAWNGIWLYLLYKPRLTAAA